MWIAFAKKSENPGYPEHLTSFLSTLEDKHGNADDHTEGSRVLVSELRKKTQDSSTRR
ncbi:MAG: hypothetical protein ABJA20_11360 [Novosphingobium sp.]